MKTILLLILLSGCTINKYYNNPCDCAQNSIPIGGNILVSDTIGIYNSTIGIYRNPNMGYSINEIYIPDSATLAFIKSLDIKP